MGLSLDIFIFDVREGHVKTLYHFCQLQKLHISHAFEPLADVRPICYKGLHGQRVSLDILHPQEQAVVFDRHLVDSFHIELAGQEGFLAVGVQQRVLIDCQNLE